MAYSKFEEEIKDLYQGIWSKPSRINRGGTKKILGWHYGFYEEGIKTIHEAMKNMNNYIGRILDIDNKKPMKILELGSGIGATTLHLARKYPNCKFYGLDIAFNEVEMAKLLQKNSSINNVVFQQGSYMNSGFADNSFDRIYALESVIYSPDKKKFLKEVYRLLKPNGKIIIIDTFTKNYLLNQLTITLDNYLHQRKNSKNELLKYYMDIDPFETIFKKQNFKQVKVRDLVESNNVKKSHIYAFLIYRLFISIPAQLKKIKENKKMSLFRYILNYPFVFSTFFIYKFLLIFITKPSYYLIEAKK